VVGFEKLIQLVETDYRPPTTDYYWLTEPNNSANMSRTRLFSAFIGAV
jgi:hypothetical protein